MGEDETIGNSTKVAGKEGYPNSHGGLHPEDASESSPHMNGKERLENSSVDEGSSHPQAEDFSEGFYPRTESTAEHLSDVPQPDWKNELETFRVFTWICATPVQPESTYDDYNCHASNETSRPRNNTKPVGYITVNQQKLLRCLQAAHDHLSTRKSYLSCQRRRYTQIAWGETGRTFLHVQRIFELFLPLGHQSTIAEKYWGGFQRIVLDATPMDDLTYSLLMDCALKCQELLGEFSKESGPSASELAIPNSLYNAFLTITCFMTSYNSNDVALSLAGRGLLEKFSRQMKQGRELMMRGIDPTPLSAKEAILPSGILASMLKWLLEDSRTEERNKLDVTYQNAVNELERRAYRRVQNEEDEEDLWFLMQDIGKITNVIKDQESLFSKLEDCLSASAGRSSREPAFAVGKQSAILFRAMKTASFKQNFFEDLARKRGYIEELHNKNYIAKKDDQEAASLTFAIVSVIFLPLTTVASILGMNTREVRDMQQTQWVFWATGIPLAILTGMFCLWCTSRFTKFKQWFRNHLFPRPQSVNTNSTRSENRMGLQITPPDRGPDSDGEQISTIRRRWKRSKNREDQANNQV
ncbi:hypothetical protein IWZ01DRAFT_218614 [Phyllosticta capitalensis]